jgi:hypothetical protein
MSSQAIASTDYLSLIAEGFAQDFHLHSFQRLIFQAIENNSRVCVVASRQIGKSETLLRLALAYAQAYPKQLILIVSAGERQASEILKRLKQTLHQQRFTTELSKESATELELKHNGSRIISLPNNPATVRGYPCHLLIVDEVDSIQDWQAFTSALWPSVSRTNGKIVCSGTYHGKRQLYELTKDPLWKTLIFSWTVNPPEDIEQQRHDLPSARFAEEFECIAVDEAGSLFPYEVLQACINPSLNNFSTVKRIGSRYFAGYDPAKLSDPSIFSILEDFSDNDPVRLIYSTDLSGRPYSDQAKVIKEWYNKLDFQSLAVDCTGAGVGVAEMLQANLGSRVNPITFNRNNKGEMINNLRIAFQDKLIEIPDDRLLLKELHDLDPNTLDHRSGGTSDRVWALALAWQEVKESYRGNRLDDSHVLLDLGDGCCLALKYSEWVLKNGELLPPTPDTAGIVVDCKGKPITYAEYYQMKQEGLLPDLPDDLYN